ncbi:MAG: molybdenum cofactor guanylyltransferase [Verrucomicrobiota bacterium]|nr:molybdenum cofactor guanylyltransferase [Verrucomicrobiota bacterium]
MKTLTAVLFAGGESRRMGSDKATLLVNGEPLWARQLLILRALRPAKVLISARTRPVWCPPEVELVLDKLPSRGPLSGVAAALKTIQTTHLLALAIDLPQMTSLNLRHLWSLARMGIGVVPQNRRFFEPLCAIYPVEAINTAEQALATKDVSMHGFVRVLATRKQIDYYAINRSERAAYKNANTPKLWNHWSATHCR